MRRLLAVVGFVACLSGVVHADTLAPAAFTRHLAQALTAALRSSTVTVKGDLELTIRDASGREATVFLTNAYNEYARDPQRLNGVVQTYVTALSQPMSAGTKVDRSRIVPIIKDRKWLADLHATLGARGAGEEHLFDSFNNELVVVYAEDDPMRMRYLTTREDIGVDRKEIRALAVANLKRILPKIEMRNHDNVFSIISVGGDYEASLLLIDDIWSGGQIKVNGDIVAAVPARDVLLVTGSRNRTGLKKVRELAAEFAAQDRYRLVDTLFVYRKGHFTKFGAN